MSALQASYDVGGVAYPRPFKIRRLGHFGFNVADMNGGIDFYSRLLGHAGHHAGRVPCPRRSRPRALAAARACRAAGLKRWF
jgi:hypothetical protein